MAACGSAQRHYPAAAAVVHPVAQAATASQTVTFAQTPGEEPQYVFPLNPSEFYTFGNDQRFDYLLYPPLYSLDNNGEPGLNASRSLAQPAKFTVNKAGDSVATLVLKHYSWSDGKPVTSRDVQFWMNLMIANKAEWGDYVPKQFPDNIKKIAYPSASKIVVTFNSKYNTTWLQDNELVQINPIPQHVWDRTSLTGKVGNYDMTTKGAVAVRNFLNAQSRQGSTYATSPLWRVVDGAWKISQFVPSTGYLALVRNTKYSGPAGGNVTKLIELPFTSTVAEMNALRSGSVDYGYVPTEDATAGQE
ncbi:MAG: ABC transporter substrate-binding protein, partial [Solirubrobacteraceae bacterium]